MKVSRERPAQVSEGRRARAVSKEEFVAVMAAWLEASGFRVGADVSGLPSKAEETVLHLVGHLIAGLVGLHAGPTGTKEVTAEEARKALSGFLEGADVLGWSLGARVVLIPVFAPADGGTAEECRELLRACLQAAHAAMTPLSRAKYGGYVCVFPMIAYFDERQFEQAAAALSLEGSHKSFGQKVEMVAGLIDLPGRKVHWPESVFSQPMADYAMKVFKRPEIFGDADLRALLA